MPCRPSACVTEGFYVMLCLRYYCAKFMTPEIFTIYSKFSMYAAILNFIVAPSNSHRKV